MDGHWWGEQSWKPMHQQQRFTTKNFCPTTSGNCTKWKPTSYWELRVWTHYENISPSLSYASNVTNHTTEGSWISILATTKEGKRWLFLPDPWALHVLVYLRACQIFLDITYPWNILRISIGRRNYLIGQNFGGQYFRHQFEIFIGFSFPHTLN